MDIQTKENYMELALNQAKIAIEQGEVPVGSILVYENDVIASGYNQSISLCDPSAHAEIQVIRKAAKIRKNHRLLNSTLFVTLEPCAMCFGAIIQARITNVIFGAYDKKTGVCGSCIDLNSQKCFNHRPVIQGGILEIECSQLITSYFSRKRN